MNREKRAEGYRKRADRDEAIAEEFEGASRESNEFLGDAPAWQSESEER